MHRGKSASSIGATRSPRWGDGHREERHMPQSHDVRAARVYARDFFKGACGRGIYDTRRRRWRRSSVGKFDRWRYAGDPLALRPCVTAHRSRTGFAGRYGARAAQTCRRQRRHRARPVPQPFASAWTKATPPQNNWGYGASRAERRPYPSRSHDTVLDLLSRVGGALDTADGRAIACCSVAPSDRRSAEHEATIPRPLLAIRRAPCATRSQQMTFGRSSRGRVVPWLGRRPNMRCHSGA